MDREAYHKAVAAEMPERELEDGVLALALGLGYRRYHALPARSKDGERWRTHQRGEVGFPDLHLVHTKTGAVAVFELKTAKGVVTEAQQEWLDAYALNPHIDSGVWRPMDLLDGTIGELLVEGAGVLDSGPQHQTDSDDSQ